MQHTWEWNGFTDMLGSCYKGYHTLDTDTESSWERLCAFLALPVPAFPYPRVHMRGASVPQRPLPTEPALIEQRMRTYLDRLAEEAFAPPTAP